MEKATPDSRRRGTKPIASRASAPSCRRSVEPSPTCRTVSISYGPPSGYPPGGSQRPPQAACPRPASRQIPTMPGNAALHGGNYEPGWFQRVRVRNPKAPRALVIPFTDVCNTGEEHRKPEPHQSFVEPLLPTPQPQTAILGYRHIQIDRQVLMCPQVVHDPAALLTPDHVRIEPPSLGRLERPHPSDRLPS